MSEQALQMRSFARQIHLRYLMDSAPGITRKLSGKIASYYDVDGAKISDESELSRIKKLAVPPAYTDVWISPLVNSHLQATGKDARGRKQYRYHADWRMFRNRHNHERMVAFGEVLPKIRTRLTRDLMQKNLTKEKIIATVISIMDKTLIRVGNEVYARKNESFGLTTLQRKHAKITDKTIELVFRGKSGKEFDITIEDKTLAAIVKKSRELPGWELFSYVHDGKVHSVDSSDINIYLHDIAQDHFTAKDFRTWWATVYCLDLLLGSDGDLTKTARSHQVIETVMQVAQKLGNTPAVCRKNYIDARVIEVFEEGNLAKMMQKLPQESPAKAHFSQPEVKTLAFLRYQLI